MSDADNSEPDGASADITDDGALEGETAFLDGDRAQFKAQRL